MRSVSRAGFHITWIPDRREALAERRELEADFREEDLDVLADDRRASAVSDGKGQRPTLDRAEDRLERLYKGMDRRRARLARDEAEDSREHAEFQRDGEHREEHPE